MKAWRTAFLNVRTRIASESECYTSLRLAYCLQLAIAAFATEACSWVYIGGWCTLCSRVTE